MVCGVVQSVQLRNHFMNYEPLYKFMWERHETYSISSLSIKSYICLVVLHRRHFTHEKLQSNIYMDSFPDYLMSTEPMGSICSLALYWSRSLSRATINRHSVAVFVIEPNVCVFCGFVRKDFRPEELNQSSCYGPYLFWNSTKWVKIGKFASKFTKKAAESARRLLSWLLAIWIRYTPTELFYMAILTI